MNDEQPACQHWIPVIGRSLAYLCMHVGDLKDKNLGDKASFLESLGIERKDVAAMLGSSYGSISELVSKANRTRKGAKKRGRRSKGRKTR